MVDNKYKMLSLFEFSYTDNLPVRSLINICNQIQADGFNPSDEFDEQTILSILSDDKYKKVAKKDYVVCSRKSCKKRALRDTLCRNHLLMIKKNVCNEEGCNNLKYKFHSGKKKEKLYDFCYLHRKEKRVRFERTYTNVVRHTSRDSCSCFHVDYRQNSVRLLPEH